MIKRGEVYMSYQSFEVIILGAIGSIVATVIMFIIVKIYKSIPSYRKKYLVSLHIKTIQGDSETYTNKSLNYLFLIFPISLFIMTLLSLYILNTTLSSAEEVLNKNITINKKVKETIKVEETKQTLKSLKIELKDRVSNAKFLYSFIVIILIISVLWFYWLALYRITYNQQRDKLTFDYQRLRNLLFTLILKEDKIKLFNQEIQVVDEVTLKKYTVLLIQYAEKNNINNVKEVMWLWDEK